MPAVTLYHNPRCSKSRKTLELLEAHGVHPKIVLYLETPLAKGELAGLLKKLGLTPGQLRNGQSQLTRATMDGRRSLEGKVSPLVSDS